MRLLPSLLVHQHQHLHQTITSTSTSTSTSTRTRTPPLLVLEEEDEDDEDDAHWAPCSSRSMVYNEDHVDVVGNSSGVVVRKQGTKNISYLMSDKRPGKVVLDLFSK